jgi:aryl-alcohol dehydrogenase
LPYPAKAAIVYEPGGAFALESVELDELQDHELLIRVAACGICHTDLKFQGRLKLPCVFGHEGAGTVEAVGASVARFKPGDRVVLSYPWCGNCSWCVSGEPYRCIEIPKLKFGGCRSDGTLPVTRNGKGIASAFFQQSSFATYAVAHENVAVKVDTDMPAELLAALPCGIQTGSGAVLNTFKVRSGEALVVFGVGAVGMSAVMAGRIVGANPVIAVDIVPMRTELALALGATHALDATDSDLVKRIMSVLPEGARYALDCSATEAGLKNAIEVIGPGGKVGIFSAPPAGETFPFTTRTLFEKVASLHAIVQGSSVPTRFIPELIRFHQAGLFPFERIVTSYPFEEINQAIADSKSGKVVKPVLRME